MTRCQTRWSTLYQSKGGSLTRFFSAGSFALYGATVPRDSGVAAKLRAAGVVILGKTNLSQWANFRSDNSTNGWSAYGGQTYAAYFPAQDPSGSSSGSGVSSSIGLALAALGTEVSAITSPEHACLIVTDERKHSQSERGQQSRGYQANGGTYLA